MRLLTFFGLMIAILVGSAAPADGRDFEFDDDAELVEVFSVFSMSTATAGGTYSAAVVADIAPGWHINSARPRQDYLIAAEVAFDTIEGLVPDGIRYPDGEEATLADELMSVYSDRLVIPFRVTIAADLADGNYLLPVSLTHQPCNNTQCRAPQTVEVPLKISVGAPGHAINQTIFTGSTILPETPAASGSDAPGDVKDESELTRYIRDYGFWGYFLVLGVAFVTGLVLSFSPCTYPMIPITVSIFAGQERSVGRGFLLSLVYVGTMAIVYGLMGLVVSLAGGVFGAWLANPIFVIGIVIVFVVFAMSMFGLYELNVPSALRQKLGATKTEGGVIGSIVLGVVAALVVSPCVGPFVAGILLYIATAGSPPIGFLVLFVFALGLGTLFVIIGTFSTAINRMPKAGEWMEQVKKFFGFVLLLMAVYFLQTLISPELTAVITALLLIAFGVFGGGLDRLTGESGFFPRLKKFLGILALILGAYLLIGTLVTQGFIVPAASAWLPLSGTSDPVAETGIRGWETDLETGLARARTEGKPVIIDTWATWCVNCGVLERKTFSRPEVGVEAERFVPIKVQLEKADSPETIAFMERFGMKVYSLPTTLLLNSRGDVRKIMIGLVGPDELIAEMKKL